MLIEMTPETEAELIRQAAAQGVDVRVYAARLLEQAAEVSASTKTLTVSGLRAVLKEMSQFRRKTPSLSDEALSRESVSADHD